MFLKREKEKEWNIYRAILIIIVLKHYFASLTNLSSSTVKYGDLFNIEYFPGEFSKVLLTSKDDPKLPELLREIDDGGILTLDLEWKPDFGCFNHIALFQIGSSKGALLIRQLDVTPSPVLREFIESHKFIGKGTFNDRKKLTHLFGKSLKINMEDVEKTRLIPYNHSLRFDDMVETFYGVSTVPFKDKEISISNWMNENLTLPQFLYAGFDAISLYKCIDKFPPPMSNKQRKLAKKEKKKASKKTVAAICTKEQVNDEQSVKKPNKKHKNRAAKNKIKPQRTSSKTL